MANTEGTGAEKKTTPRKPVVAQKGSKMAKPVNPQGTAYKTGAARPPRRVDPARNIPTRSAPQPLPMGGVKPLAAPVRYDSPPPQEEGNDFLGLLAKLSQSLFGQGAEATRQTAAQPNPPVLNPMQGNSLRTGVVGAANQAEQRNKSLWDFLFNTDRMGP